MDMPTFLARLPKVELHCHLEGAIRSATFAELATKHGMPLKPYQDPAELYAFEPTVESALGVYSQIAQSVRDREDFCRVTYEALQEAADYGVRYIELFWSPMEHLNIGVPYSVQVEGIVDGIRSAEHDHHIQCRAISAINRQETPEKGFELVQMMIEHRSDHVIGLALDYDELGHPPEEFWKSYRLAKAAGFHRTAHACEWARPPRDVETCLDLLGCERIDHGYRVLLDPRITQRCADEGVVFTVIPLTAVFGLFNPQDWTAAGLDPSVPAIRQMVNRGLKVMLNADDPGMLNFSRAQEYGIAADVMRFTPADFKQFTLNGIQGSWLDESTKRQWASEWTREIDDLMAQLDAAPAT